MPYHVHVIFELCAQEQFQSVNVMPRLNTSAVTQIFIHKMMAFLLLFHL